MTVLDMISEEQGWTRIQGDIKNVILTNSLSSFFITISSTHHAWKDLGESVDSSHGFGLASSETVFKLVERLPHGIGVRDLGIVYKCDVSHSPSLENKGNTFPHLQSGFV